MKELRPYQQEGRFKVNQLLNSKRHPLLVMPTASGKTFTSIKIADDRISLRKKIILIVPQLEIFSEFINECSEQNLNYGYINDEGIIGRNKDIYICMAMSLESMLSSLPEKFCRSIKEIFTDEVQHAMAQTWINIYKHFSHCLRLGLTATPIRMDNKPLNRFYTDIVEPIKMTEAIANKSLCEPIIIIPDEYKNIIPGPGEKINIDIQKQKIHPKKIIGDMVKLYRDVFNGLPVIIPCTTFEHASIVTDMYKNERWNVDHIHSGLSKFERKSILQRVKSNKTNILVSVGIGVEGMNIPGLYGIIWMRLTESLTVFMQFNGRPMRPAPGKSRFILVDPVGNCVLHGRPDIDRKWSLENDYIPGQDSETIINDMKLCPCCGVMNSNENNKCHICQFDFITGLFDGEPIDKKKRKLPTMVDGQLVFLDYNEFEQKVMNNVINKSGEVKEEKKIELSTTEKVEILSKNLTGFGLKTKFKEGLKWL